MTVTGNWPGRPRRRYADLYVGLGIFIVALVIYLSLAFPLLGDTEFYGVSLDASTTQLIHQLGGSDSGSYLRLSVDFLDGNVSPENRWILNLWPPGVPFLLWIFMSLSGGASPIVPMIVFTGSLWSTALALLGAILVRRRSYIVFVLFSVAWLFGPLLNGWTIKSGVISSDGISAALTAVLAIGLYFATQREFVNLTGNGRTVYFIGIGTLLGVLSLFRVTWLYATIASLAAVTVFIIVVAMVRRFRRNSPSTRIPTTRKLVVTWTAVFAGFSMLAVPWTIALGTVVHQGNYSWSNGDYQFAQLWLTDTQLEDANAGFLINGEANWACEIDMKQCREIQFIEMRRPSPYDGTGIPFAEFQERAVVTAITHPFEFIGVRSVTTFESWLSVPGQPVGSMTATAFGLVSLLLFLFSCVLLIRDSVKGRSAAFFLLMLVGANVGMIWLSHFETRYIMPLQTIGLVLAALAFSTRERSSRDRMFRWIKEHSHS